MAPMMERRLTRRSRSMTRATSALERRSANNLAPASAASCAPKNCAAVPLALAYDGGSIERVDQLRPERDGIARRAFLSGAHQAPYRVVEIARRSCARTALLSPGNNPAVGWPGPHARSHSQLPHKPQIATCCGPTNRTFIPAPPC